MRETGRTALVTGGGRGIGLAVATALAGAGHRVVVFGRQESFLRAAVESGAASDHRVVDLTDEPALLAAIADVGPVDILVNNAGIADSAPFARTDTAFLRRIFAINVESVFAASRAVLPGMVARGFGRIISVASIAGLKGIPYASAYTASKHAVIGMTRALAVEVAKSGVTVNAVCPGYVDTDLVSENATRIAAKTGRSVESIVRDFHKGNPQQRLIRTDEVADAVLWLSGDLAGSVNGHALAMSGGEI
jgi:NAD(P)-dependent dehydrogenase (short-subunit alcohol dehydrogenase family)